MNRSLMMEGMIAMATSMSVDEYLSDNILPKSEQYKLKVHKQKRSKAEKTKQKQKKSSKKRNRK